MAIYILYDKPEKLDNMSFLTSSFEKEYVEIYPEFRCTSVKRMLSACRASMKQVKSGDTIVCWYDFMAVICWWMSKFTHKKIKIIAINILLKDKNTTKNKIAKFLYKKALLSESFDATVTTDEYGQYIKGILKINIKFTLLHDVYHQSYLINQPIETIPNTVFCGGRNGRDWKMLFQIAKLLPDITFNCVMPTSVKEQYKDDMSNNIQVKTDIPESEFMNFLCASQFVVMPLDTEAPAGLTVYFQAAANNKLILTSKTVTTEGYLSDNRGVLCDGIDDFVVKIRYYIQHMDEANDYAMRFKQFLERECSEENYSRTLWRMLAE